MNSKVMNKVLSFLLVAAVAFTTIFTPVNAATVNSRDKKLKGKIKEMHVYDGLTEIANKDTIQMAVGATKTLTIEFVDKSEKKAATHQVVAKSNNKKAVAATADYDKDLNESVVTLAVDATAKAGDKATVTIKSKAKKVKTVKFNVEVIEMVPVTGVTLDNTAPKVGDTINAKLAPETATNVVSYAWQADNTPILGATTASYVVGEADLGKKIKVVITDTEGKTFESPESEAVITDKPIPVTGVSLSETAPKVGANVDAVLAPAGANNIASYQWYADGTEIAGATTSSYVPTKTDIGKKLKIVVTDTEGATFESAESDPIIEDLSAVVTLTDKSGLQTDGTALPNDTFELSYGSTLGTPDTIIWYCNGAAAGVYTAKGGTISTGFTNSEFTNGNITAEMKAGEWHVSIENTAGQTFVSNSIIVAEEGVAVITETSFEDDYDTEGAIEIDPNSDRMILNLTMNKNYAGKLYIVKSDVEKNYTGAAIANVADFSGTGGAQDGIAASAGNSLENVKKASGLTNKAATDEITADGKPHGVYYVDADGAIHAKLIVDLTGRYNNATTATPGQEVTRGSSYYLVWDQEDLKGDEAVTTAKKADLHTTEIITVPYVTAPASIAVTAYDSAVTNSAEISFRDADGNTMAWWNAGAAGTQSPSATDEKGNSLTATYMYNIDSNKASADDSPLNITALPITKGVGTAAYTGTGKTYAYAKMKTVAGIFGEKGVELTADVVESAPKAATKVEISESATEPADAVVKFTGLHNKADGKVYIIQGESGKATKALIEAKGVDAAVASADVTGGSTEVTVANVFKKSQIGDANNGDKFVAVYVPTDTSVYSKISSDLFTLTPAPTSLSFVDQDDTMVTDAGGVTATGDAITITTDTSKVQTLNQFGDPITAGGDTIVNKACTVTAKNAGGLVSEKFQDAKFSVAANGVVTIDLVRTTAIDQGDGFEVEVLGSKFTATAKFGVGNNDKSDDDLYKVLLGSSVLQNKAVPAAIDISAGVDDAEQGLTAALAGAASGTTVTLSDNAAMTTALNIAKGVTLAIANTVTLTLGVDGNQIYGTLDNTDTAPVFAAASKTVVLHEGANIKTLATATCLTGGTKFMVSTDATTNGAKIDGQAGTGPTAKYTILKTGAASTSVGTATLVDDNTLEVDSNDTVEIVGTGSTGATDGTKITITAVP